MAHVKEGNATSHASLLFNTNRDKPAHELVGLCNVNVLPQ